MRNQQRKTWKKTRNLLLDSLYIKWCDIMKMKDEHHGLSILLPSLIQNVAPIKMRCPLVTDLLDLLDSGWNSAQILFPRWESFPKRWWSLWLPRTPQALKRAIYIMVTCKVTYKSIDTCTKCQNLDSWSLTWHATSCSSIHVPAYLSAHSMRPIVKAGQSCMVL